jgi:hypothetical protein
MPSLPAKLLAMRQSSNFGECYISAPYAKPVRRALRGGGSLTMLKVFVERRPGPS